MASRSLCKSDEGHLIITTTEEGEDHCAILVKFEEVPGYHRIKYLNEFGDRPTERSKCRSSLKTS